MKTPRRRMRFLSACSGIEAASVAWLPLGWECVGVSEIEPFPCAVLKHHYPEVPNYGDLTRQEEWKLPAFDVLCGGTPCQGFSVAGKRGGLADARSQLVWHFLEIARRERPRWVLWENVPGVLSSDGGADFGAVLGRLGECGYGFAYRILDAQYFGVAQRRRRVFVVGYLGDWRPAAAVLFERESMSGNPAPSREARERIAGAIGARTCRSIGAQDAASGHLIEGLSNRGTGTGTETLRSNSHDASEDGTGRGVPLVASPITASYGKQVDSSDTSKGPPNLLAVARALRAEGHDASEDGTGRGTPLVVDTAPCLRSNAYNNSDPAMEAQMLVAYPIQEANARQSKNQNGPGVPLTAWPADVAGTLDAHFGGKQGLDDQHINSGASHFVPAVFDPNQVTSKANRSQPQPDLSHTPPATPTPPVAFNLRGREGGAMPELDDKASLRAASGGSSRSYVAAMAVRRLTPRECDGGSQPEMAEQASLRAASGESSRSYVAFQPGNLRRGAGAAPSDQAFATLKADYGGASDQAPHVGGAMGVRRLTPRECERLQGFPDDYTLVPYRGKPAADGPRYKALGNSWAVPCARWIGERIMLVQGLIDGTL